MDFAGPMWTNLTTQRYHSSTMVSEGVQRRIERLSDQDASIHLLHLGAYQVKQFLGEGGNKRVYAALTGYFLSALDHENHHLIDITRFTVPPSKANPWGAASSLSR